MAVISLAAELGQARGTWSSGMYTNIQILGQGVYGHVMLAGGQNGQLVAIKSAIEPEDFRVSWLRSNQLLREEAEKVRRMKHPNIITVLQTFDLFVTDPQDPYSERFEHHVVYEYANRGCLEDFMELRHPMSWVSNVLCPGLLSALEHLDRHWHMIHYDIHLGNILVKASTTGQPIPVLHDFGAAKRVMIRPGHYPRAISFWKPDWMERDGAVHYTPALDVFSVPIIVALVANLPVVSSEGLRRIYHASSATLRALRAHIHTTLENAPELSVFREAFRCPDFGEWNPDTLSEGRATRLLHQIHMGTWQPNFHGLIQTRREVLSQ